MTTPRKTPQNLISVYTNAAGHTCVALFIKGVKEPVWWRTYRPSDVENVSRTGELLAKLTLALPALAKKVQYPVIFQVRSPIIARILWEGHQPEKYRNLIRPLMWQGIDRLPQPVVEVAIRANPKAKALLNAPREAEEYVSIMPDEPDQTDSTERPHP